MKKQYRIKKYSEIDAIFKKKQTKSDGYFSIYTADDNNGLHFRFAISIGKKYGKAVARNKIKRQIRMVVQMLHQEIEKQKLFVIVVKPKANTMTFQEIQASLEVLLRKSKLLENTHA